METCYSLYWTGFIFCTILESIVGWLVGLLICTLSFEIDFFADIVTRLIEVPVMKLIGHGKGSSH